MICKHYSWLENALDLSTVNTSCFFSITRLSIRSLHFHPWLKESHDTIIIISPNTARNLPWSSKNSNRKTTESYIKIIEHIARVQQPHFLATQAHFAYRETAFVSPAYHKSIKTQKQRVRDTAQRVGLQMINSSETSMTRNIAKTIDTQRQSWAHHRGAGRRWMDLLALFHMVAPLRLSAHTTC